METKIQTFMKIIEGGGPGGNYQWRMRTVFLSVTIEENQVP
jgi:hypothetical protein